MKMRFNRRRFLEISAGATVAAAGLKDIPVFAQTAVATSITLDGSGSGRTFDGIGAISGGGGNSRLLLDYPSFYRDQILDYLFQPNHGANLHILKVEVGGDTNSTDGSEASFMHTATDQNFDRGYEWWLMKEAKKRNPNIKLYGLAWGAPGWIGTTGAPVFDPNNRFWSQDMVNYYIAWIKGAQTHHGLTIDYIGGWNERGYNQAFYEAFKSAIISNGLATKIVGADSDWSVADAMISDPAFSSSIDIVGAHYPCAGGDGGSATSCTNTANAKSLGKPLWASENGSQDVNTGAQAMARALNRGYIDGKMTAYINWPLVAAVYPNLPYNTVGLMVANQPWSGNYRVGKQLWVTAHTTQFSQPGWQYIDSASGYLGGNSSNGSYVTLKSSQNNDYSVIIETVDATASQTVTFQIANGLSTRAVQIWSTNLNSANASDFFVHTSSVKPSGGSYTVTLQPGYVYTLTTTIGQGKGTFAGPPPAVLGLPYADNFASYPPSQEALYFSDQNGCFEIAAAGGGRSGQVMRQMAPTAPISWDVSSEPYTLFGDIAWTDYTVRCDALLEQAGYIEIMGRVNNQQSFWPGNINAYYLRVTNDGLWSILKNTNRGVFTTLLSGNGTALGINTWHTLELGFVGSTITAQIDGTIVGTITDSSYSAGLVGLGVSGWQNAQFANFNVAPTQPFTAGTYYKLANINSGKVLDISSASGLIVQATDSSAITQQWQLIASSNGYVKLVNHGSGKVLDGPGTSTGQGLQLDLLNDDGELNRQWLFRDTGNGTYTIINRHSKLVAAVSGASLADGAEVIMQTRDESPQQLWQLVIVPTANVTYQLVNRNSGKVMDVSGESTADGGIIIQFTNHGGANQQWLVADAGNGYFKLINANSGKVLDVPNSSTASGVQLDQWTDNGGANQQWQLVSAGNGYYTLVNHNSGLLIDVAGSSLVDIAAVVQGPSSGSLSQQWLFSPVS